MQKSYIIATTLTVAISAWILSGLVSGDDETKTSVEQKTEAAHIPNVQVRSEKATSHARVLRLYGHSEANRMVTLKAETTGTVISIAAEEGKVLKQNETILRLGLEDRDERRKSAQALVKQRELEYDASKSLSEKNFRSKTKLAETEALLESAKAELTLARLDVERTVISAPFDGVLERRLVEKGDYVSPGTETATVVELNPLVIAAEIPETAIATVEIGDVGEIKFIDGTQLNGAVRYISKAANTTTRTYRIELEVDNPDLRIGAGMTAEIRLLGHQTSSHLITPALLSLSEKGEVGLKVVNDEDMVEFYPVTLLEDTTEGVWVGGLPNQVRLITVGQEFVRAGQKVIPHPPLSDAPSAITAKSGEPS